MLEDQANDKTGQDLVNLRIRQLSIVKVLAGFILRSWSESTVEIRIFWSEAMLISARPTTTSSATIRPMNT